MPQSQPQPPPPPTPHPSHTHRSEPARSTKDSLPRATFWVCRFVLSMQMVMMRWEREDSRFMWVLLTRRPASPDSTTSISWRAEEMLSTMVAPGTVTTPLGSFLISSRLDLCCRQGQGGGGQETAVSRLPEWMAPPSWQVDQTLHQALTHPHKHAACTQTTPLPPSHPCHPPPPPSTPTHQLLALALVCQQV